MNNSSKQTEKEYNLSAKEYSRQRDYYPYYEKFEIPFTLSLIKSYGDCHDMNFLDIACGEGVYSRLIAEHLKPKRVVGVDLSKEMIKLAKLKALERKLNIEYIIGDATKLQLIDKFDCVIAMYLFHYLDKVKKIKEACKNIYKNLKKGGKVITYMLNPDLSRIPDYYDKYGFSANISDLMANGSSYSFNLLKAKQSYQVFYWEKEMIENAFRETGFKHIKWIAPYALEKNNEFDENYWEKLEQIPWCIYLISIK